MMPTYVKYIEYKQVASNFFISHYIYIYQYTKIDQILKLLRARNTNLLHDYVDTQLQKG